MARRKHLKTITCKHACDIGNCIYLLKDEFRDFETQIEVVELIGEYFITIWKL